MAGDDHSVDARVVAKGIDPGAVVENAAPVAGAGEARQLRLLAPLLHLRRYSQIRQGFHGSEVGHIAGRKR